VKLAADIGHERSQIPLSYNTKCEDLKISVVQYWWIEDIMNPEPQYTVLCSPVHFSFLASELLLHPILTF
jgi:hypothetical protein